MADDLNHPAVIVAATATGTIGVVVFALLPIYIGQIAERFDLDDVQTGLTASSYFLVYALISLSAPFWVRRWNWRHAVPIGCGVMITGLLGLLAADSALTVMIAFSITGAGAAVQLPISLTLVSDMRNTERIYALTIALGQLVPAIMLLGISAGWYGAYSLINTVYVTLLVVFVCLVLNFRLPSRGSVAPRIPGVSAPKPIYATAGLAGLAINFAAFAAMWAFFERIAAESGFDADFAARWIAVGLIMTAVGPFFSAWLADRLGRAVPLIVPTTLAAASMALLAGTVTPPIYAIVLVVFPLGYYIALSFMLSIIADADPNGSVSSLMSFAFACGALAGPALFGYLRGTENAELWLIGVALLGGVAIVLWVHRRIAGMPQHHLS